MNILLTGAEARVLGSLIEKEITTPEYYPLSLNALLHACNQKSNREPVMSLDERAVQDALRGLEQYGLAGSAAGSDSRVAKYEHRLQEEFNFDRRETAILCVLLLRGPQTPGELRGRTERLVQFDDLEAALSTLHRLMAWDPPLVQVLPRQPGTKEARYAHLFFGDAAISEPALPRPSSPGSSGPPHDERLTQVEGKIARLQAEIAELKQQLADFRKQFE